MRRAAPLLGALALAAALVPGAAGGSVPGFPQAKINHIDTSAAPRIKVYVSLLDARLRQVPEKWPDEITVYQKPEGEKRVELFSIVDGEPQFPKPEDADKAPEVPKEELPVVTIAGDDERGMAAVVVIPGYNDIAYSEGTLGERVKGGAGLFFKKLGKSNRMNAIWYNDFVSTWVEAKGRTMQLTPLTDEIRERCRAWELLQAEHHGEEPEEPSEELDPSEAHCGLTTKYEDLGKIIEAETFKGFYPNLFGLSSPLCTDKPQQERMATGALNRDGEAEAYGPPAIEVALEMLVKGALPGQPRALILLGDGRDGYIYRDRECRDHLRAVCAETNTTYAHVKKCIDDAMDKAAIKEQELFREHLPGWLALAKSAGIRIFSVVDPLASPSARERMEVLAWRSGGTARVAEDANEVVDLYSDLTAELSGQHVISFTDHDAVPGATRTYAVRLKGRGGSFTTDDFSVTLPTQEEGLAFLIADTRAMITAKLGDKVLLAIAIGLAVVLLLIVLKIVLKIAGKKGGKAAKKTGGAAKKAAAAAKKAAAAGAKAKS
ncbi:MAG: hypothetical protein H6744_11450 [Deltaproteobacteria bacterium]|nr:hypothetical protein [Deltaproteobacteria bacterium]MCB9787291.1 hypothetical protein [Deltaproteobacteria bacterium]